jgi:hypothetical protein
MHVLQYPTGHDTIIACKHDQSHTEKWRSGTNWYHDNELTMRAPYRECVYTRISEGLEEKSRQLYGCKVCIHA